MHEERIRCLPLTIGKHDLVEMGHMAFIDKTEDTLKDWLRVLWSLLLARA